jgi:hypothetical protein
MEWHARSAPKKSSERLTVWGALKALALGTLLGSIGVLCSRWLDDSPLLCTALQSAVSTMVLAVLASARPQDLVLDLSRLLGNTQETRESYGQRMIAQQSFVTS